MSHEHTRRRFLARAGAAAAGVAMGARRTIADWVSPLAAPGSQGDARPASRVVIARDDALLKGKIAEHGELLRTMVDAGMQKLTGKPTATEAWRALFRPENRVGIKVNTLGHTTQPAVVDAVVAGLRQADVPAQNIVIWDRFDSELQKHGFKLNKSGSGVLCRGTDAERYSAGYQRKIETSGDIGSCYSRILAEQVDTVISIPVLKDHSLAGVTLGMKNFYGAIHNPNKYHENNCDPYIVDIVSHRFIRPRWRLTVCDATIGQYNGGPMRMPGFWWRFGGLIMSTDFVACDAIGSEIIQGQREAKGMPSLMQLNRPPRHIATAGARGLGEADLSKIEQIEI